MIPFWLKLIRTYMGNGGLGLTLPFLIGAQRNPIGSLIENENQNIEEIKKMLLSMRDDTPDSSYISVNECGTLQQPVFNEGSSFHTPPEIYIRIPRLKEINYFLYIAPDILPSAKQNLEGLLENLWKRNGQAILKGNFSYFKGKGTFTKFTDSDIALIEKAKLIKDDEEA